MLGVISNGELAADLRDAAAKKADGFTAFKIKVGIDKPLVDAERTRRVCEALGPGCLISSDANTGWSTDEAVQYVRAVAGSGLTFFEQPVAADDVAGMAAVAAADAGLAIGADESIHSLADIRRHHDAQGGARREPQDHQARRHARRARGRRAVRGSSACRSTSSCKTGESSIACAAGLHIAAALPQLAWGLTLSNEGLTEDVTARPIRIERGHVEVSDRPGLGIDVDEDRIRRHRRDVAQRHVA